MPAPRAILAAATALALTTGVPAAVSPGPIPALAATTDQGGAEWPEAIASVPDDAATVEDSPPGTSLMAYRVGTEEDPRPGATPLVLAAHEDVYRRVAEAQERSVDSDLGAPAPMLLSPDGRTLAVGSSRGNGTVALIDLATGEQQVASLSYVTAGTPTAFDLDNGWLWVRARATSDDAAGTTTYDDWEWHRVDLGTARATRTRELGRAMDLATVPGGRTVLVKDSGTRARLFDTGTLEPVGDPIPVSGDLEPGGVSPDGATVATGTRGGVRLQPLDGGEPTEVEVDGDIGVHGWIDEETLLVSETLDDGTWQLSQLPLDGDGEVVSQLPPDDGDTLQTVSVATGLVDEVRTRAPGEPDHGAGGPLPWVLGGAALLAAAGGVLLVRRRR